MSAQASGATSGPVAGATQGAAQGAAAGTAILPGWGTGIGAAIGLTGGLLQASQQASAARNFQQQQDRAVEEAKRQAGANFMQNISAPTEAYQAAMQQGTAQQMQALQAGAEGDVRNLQGIVGRTNEAATDFDFEQRDKMARDLYQLHLAQAQEQKGSANALAGIDLNEAQGYGMAKQQAQKAQQQAMMGVLGTVAGIGEGIDKRQALYKRQPTQSTQPAYNPATDPILNNINKYGNNQQPLVGPELPSDYIVNPDYLSGLSAFNNRPI